MEKQNVQIQSPEREECSRRSGVKNMIGQREMRTFAGHVVCAVLRFLIMSQFQVYAKKKTNISSAVFFR